MDIIGRSLSAAAVIAVIIFMRKAMFKKLPKRVLSALWLIAAAKLLLPFEGITLIGTGASDTAVTEVAYAAVQGAQFAQSVPIIPNSVVNVAVSMPALENELFIIKYIWLFGAVFVSTFFIFSHIKSRKTFSCALPADYDISALKREFKIMRPVRLLVSDRTDSPLTYGVFSPVIILPKSMELYGDGVRNVLCHELAHIKRFDALFKAVIALCAAVHWFNPLAWVMFVLANRDIELACDETALSRGKSAPEDYAMTLIHVEESRIPAGRSFPLAGSFSGGKLEERIRDVMATKKSVLAGLSAAAVSVAAASALNVSVMPYGEAAYSAAVCEASDVYEYPQTSDNDVYYVVTEDSPDVYSLHSYRQQQTTADTYEVTFVEAYYSDYSAEAVSEADYMISVAEDVPSIEIGMASAEITDGAAASKTWYPPQGYYTVIYDYPTYAHAFTTTGTGGIYTDTTVRVTVADNGSEVGRQTKITPMKSR